MISTIPSLRDVRPYRRSPSGQVPETAGASTDANPNLVPLLIGGAALLLLAPTLMHKRR